MLASLGHPSKLQRVSRLVSVTARHSSSGRQPKFAALNRGRHLTFGRAAIALGVGSHSSLIVHSLCFIATNLLVNKDDCVGLLQRTKWYASSMDWRTTLFV